MKVLVTGGLGFIGSHLVRRLAADGCDVVVLDSIEPQVHGSQEPPEIPSGVDCFFSSCGSSRILDALEGVEAVVHLAAVVGVGQSMYDVARYVRRNTLETAEMLEAICERAYRIRRLVVASSMSIYGEGAYETERGDDFFPRSRSRELLEAGSWDFFGCRPVATNERKPLYPSSVYAITKRDHEELALVVGDAYEIPTAALRFFNVYGPGQALSNPYTGAAAIFACQALNGERPTVFEDGRQLRDLVHVSDVVEALVLALRSRATGAFNVGTGHPTSVLHLAQTISDRLGGPEPLVLNRARAGDVRHCFADVEAAAGELGFRSRVEISAGLEELCDYLRARAARSGAPKDLTRQAHNEMSARGLVK